MAEPLAFDIIARDRASATTQRIGKNFQGLKASTVGAFAGMGAALGTFALQGLSSAARAVSEFVTDSVRQFVAFDRSMREVWTLLPDLSADAFKSLQGDVRGFVTEMGIAHQEAVPALYQAISAGVPQGGVFDFLTTAAKASIGGVTTLETAVDGLTTAINAYGRENLSAQQASDILFTTMRLGKTNIGELSANLFQVLPTAAALGISFGTVGAALSTITTQTGNTAVSTTQLRQLFVELNKESGKTGQLFDDLAGKSFRDFIRDGGSVQEALALLKVEADDNNTSLSNLFGSVEAGNAALALTSESGAKAFNGALGEMQDSAGATDQAFGRMDEGIGRSWDRLRVRADDLKIALGEKLAPAILAVFDHFGLAGDGADKAGKKWEEFGQVAQEQTDEKILPALARFSRSASDTGSENEQMALTSIRALGSLAKFWINNLNFMLNALTAWKDFVVGVWMKVIDVWAAFVEASVRGAAIAFGWIPGIGDKLKGLHSKVVKFRQDVNRELDKLRSRKTIDVTIRYASVGEGAPTPGRRQFFHSGGLVGASAFGAMRDVPAMLRTGEFVVNRNAAQSNLPLLRAINSGGSPNVNVYPSFSVQRSGRSAEDLLVEMFLGALRTRGSLKSAVKAAAR